MKEIKLTTKEFQALEASLSAVCRITDHHDQYQNLVIIVSGVRYVKFVTDKYLSEKGSGEK